MAGAALRRALVLGAAAAVAAGCSDRSRVDPAAPVVVAGVVRAPDGSPLAGRPVRMGGGVGTDEGLFAVLTLGLGCTTGACTGAVFDATTAADGSYRFQVAGRDTQSTFGQALSQLVSVSAAPTGSQVSGAAASARFRVQVEDVRLPVLELVDPGLAVEGGTDVVARWSTTRPGPYEVTFEQAEAVPVWLTTVNEGAASVDPRVLEDTRGRVVVSGGSTDAGEGSDVVLRWRSPGVGYVAGAGPPPSRGRPCRVVDEAGAVRASTGACAVTDGDLATLDPTVLPCAPAGGGTAVSAAPASSCPRAAGVLVDLGRPLPVEVVVVRGCDGGCAVEVSDDGTAFRPAGAVSHRFGTVGLDGRPVVAVRVSHAAGGGLREVSVWGGRPGTAALRSADAEDGRLRRVFSGDGGTDEEVPPALAALAALLAAAAVGATGYVAGRGRRRM